MIARESIPGPQLAQLRTLVADAIPRLTWRHSGLGMLQAYLNEGSPLETRVHVHHRDLIKPGIYDSGAIHDHRFTLHSSVLAGALINYDLAVKRSINGLWRLYSVTNARRIDAAAKAEVALTPENGLHSVIVRSADRLVAGDAYTIPKGAFHRSEIERSDCATVTLITKYDQDDGLKARIAGMRYAAQPTHAFTDSLLPHQFQPYLLDAANALRLLVDNRVGV